MTLHDPKLTRRDLMAAAALTVTGAWSGSTTQAADGKRSALLRITGKELVTIPTKDIVSRIPDFRPGDGRYGSVLNGAYQEAMRAISLQRLYRTPTGNSPTYGLIVDPTTEVHESLHAMSRDASTVLNCWLSEGRNVFCIPSGAFVKVEVGVGITKGHAAGWIPEDVRSYVNYKSHFTSSPFMETSVAMVFEEFACHVLDAVIDRESAGYIGGTLGLTRSSLPSCPEWAVLALGVVTMLEQTKGGFPTEQAKTQCLALVKQLTEQGVALYAEGIATDRFGKLGLFPSHFTRKEGGEVRFVRILSEQSGAAAAIRRLCATYYGEEWLVRLVDSIDKAIDTRAKMIQAAAKKAQ